MSKNFLMVLLLGFSQNVFAQIKKSNFGFDQLKSEILANNIRKIDDLFSKIPDEMKKNSMLVYKSRALNKDVIDFMSPRIILFNRDASLVLSISPNPGEKSIAKGEDALELMVFNSVSGRFELYREVFNGINVPFSGVVKKNPKACVSCHSSDPTPQFHDYNGWPGFYGSFGTRGVAVKGSAEYSGLVAFLEKQKYLPRYKELDLSGFYGFPEADIVQVQNAGTAAETKSVVASAGSVGTAYRTTGFLMDTKNGAPEKLYDMAGFNVNMAFGIEIEKLMHKRMAKKFSRMANFDNEILPILYYLGNTYIQIEKSPNEVVTFENGQFGNPNTRCGHPNLRIKNIWETIAAAAFENRDVLAEVELKISQQIQSDFKIRESLLDQTNIRSAIVDPRGIAPVLVAGFFPVPINKSPDADNFKKQMVILELLGQKWGLSTSDISTGLNLKKDKMVLPTTGIFHLSRLGKLPVDEQYFQNLMSGLKWAASEKIAALDKLSCDEVEQSAMNATKKLFGNSSIKIRENGLMYKSNLK